MTSQQDYRRAIARAVKPKDIELVMRKLVVDALRGDHRATKILLDRVLGRVPQTIHLEGDLEVTATPALESLDAASRKQLREILLRERARSNGTSSPSPN